MEHHFCQRTSSNISNVIIRVTIIYKVIRFLSLLETRITKWSNQIIQNLFFWILYKLLNLELYNLRFDRIITLIILLLIVDHRKQTRCFRKNEALMRQIIEK